MSQSEWNPNQQGTQNQHAAMENQGLLGGGQWVAPQVVRISDADVERIAAAVVRLLGERTRREPMAEPDYQTIGEVLFRTLPEDTGDVVLLFEDSAGKLHCISTAAGADATMAMILRLLRSEAGSLSVHTTTDPH